MIKELTNKVNIKVISFYRLIKLNKKIMCMKLLLLSSLLSSCGNNEKIYSFKDFNKKINYLEKKMQRLDNESNLIKKEMIRNEIELLKRERNILMWNDSYLDKKINKRYFVSNKYNLFTLYGTWDVPINLNKDGIPSNIPFKIRFDSLAKLNKILKTEIINPINGEDTLSIKETLYQQELNKGILCKYTRISEGVNRSEKNESKKRRFDKLCYDHLNYEKPKDWK